jgi:hypothetical protein
MREGLTLDESAILSFILERSESLPRPPWGEADALPRAAGEGPISKILPIFFLRRFAFRFS